MIVVIVVTDDNDGLALRLQLRQQLIVEDLLEQWILIGGPLVKKIDSAVFQISRQQCQPFALSLRKVERGECAVLNFDLVRQLQLRDVFTRTLIEFRTFKSEQTLEQVKVREHHREVLPKLFPVLARD